MRKFKNRLISTNYEEYAAYLEDCKTKNKKVLFSLNEYRDFTDYFNAWFIDELILSGRIYELPYRLGRMVILKSRSQVNTVPDWEHFRNTGEYRVIRNEHTQGYKCSIYHLGHENYISYDLRNPLCYYCPTRYSSRRTAFLLKNNPDLIHKYQSLEDYREYVSSYKRRAYMKRHVLRKDLIKKTKQV